MRPEVADFLMALYAGVGANCNKPGGIFKCDDGPDLRKIGMPPVIESVLFHASADGKRVVMEAKFAEPEDK